ncbi:MAG: oligoendopeptidase F [Acidobacteria bacterium]|nr:MAG: oligoendopeptidase F [Acidobacteriota bacterium]
MSVTPAPPATAYEVRAWDLSDLLSAPDEEVIARRLEDLAADVEAFAGARGELRPDMDPQRFLALLKQYEALVEKMDVLDGYASLRFASDTQSTAALSLRNRLQRVLTGHENRILFFRLWWKGLEDEQAERLLPDAEREPDLRHYLLDLRRTRPYTLDERTEQVINLKDMNGASAILTLYSMLTNRLTFELELEGETRLLTDGEIRSLYFSPDPEIRRASYLESFRVYEQESKILAQIYANRVRDWYTEHVELRGFASPIAVRNVANDIPDRAVEVLLEVVKQNAPLFQDYFRLKSRLLGLDRLRRFDVYAPLASSDRKIPFADAVEAVLATFRRFDPRFAELAERVFARNHIDSEIRLGKKGGAFCSTILPRLTPWVLINYNQRVRDVATLAHELGHAVHSMLASHHSVLTQHPSLPLAETASVFAEMLMTDRLLADESDPVARRELLAAAIDDVYATILRQTYFVLFELDAHRAILDDASGEDLERLYLQNLRQQFGDEMEIDPAFRFEWVSIPHIFQTPFYCYSYSFGQLLVLALYRRYQQEGEAFKPRYLRLLSHGGAARPEELLGEMGIDVTDPAFWQSGFEVVRGMIDELRSIGT